MLAQARDALQLHAVLQSLDGLFDTPALVVQIAERMGRRGLLIEVGGLSVTHVSSAPERMKVVCADQPLSLSQRMQKRIPRSPSNATSQAAG